MKFVTVHIGGTEKKYINVHYVKSHPSQDPDTFDITLDPDEASGIDSFDTVEIKKNGVTEFYGFVEEITPQDSEEGLEYVVTGRCWKLILWKKWTERYQESREVGPADIHGNVESGFFGSVSSEELIKFIMRCPMSIHPEMSVRHKIGWGIPSDNWSYCTNETAECFYPDWVGMRTTGLSWRSRGQISEMSITNLVVDVFDSTYTEWNTVGASPWLDTDDGTTSYINTRYIVGNKKEGCFTFEDLGPTAVSIYSVHLNVKQRCSFYLDPDYVKVYLYDGTSWHDLGYMTTSYFWGIATFDVTTILDTPAKVNSAKIYFEVWGGVVPESGGLDITYAYIKVQWATLSGDVYQQDGDYFIINLGEQYDRVTAMLLECRNNPNNYARNYEIKYATLSNCCGLDEADWHDFDPPVDVVDNEFRDILHSWKPQDDVHCIRVKLTASADAAWEISQAYVWQADEDIYRLMDE